MLYRTDDETPDNSDTRSSAASNGPPAPGIHSEFNWAQDLSQANFLIKDWNVAEASPGSPVTDLFATNPAALEHAYAGLWAKISRAFVTNIVFSLVIVLFALITLTQQVQDKGEEAKQSMQRACSGLEVGATALASLPHYAADGINSMTIDGVNGIVTHTASMLVGAVQLLNQLILMLVERYTGLLFCLLDVVVQLAVGTVAMYADEVVGFVNTQLAAISDALTSSLALLNGELQSFQSEIGDVINSIAGVFGGSVSADVFEPVTFPGVSNKLNFQIPTDFVTTLQTLSVPTLASLEQQLADLISEPFEMLEALIDTELGDLTGLATTDVIVPVPSAVARISFCAASMDYGWVDVMVAAISKALWLGIYLLIAVAAGAIVSNIVAISYEHWLFEREVRSFSKVLQQHQQLHDQIGAKEEQPNKKQSRAIARDLIHAATHPTAYRFTTWFTRFTARSEEGSIRFRWFIDYISHPPSLVCFFAGLVGIGMVLLQMWLISEIQSETGDAVAKSLTASMDAVVRNVETAMVDVAQPYADSINGRLDSLESTVNGVLFGWVGTTMDAINNTLLVFASGLDNALSGVFDSVPPLQTALDGFVQCVLGSSVTSLESIATGLKSHAQVDFPRINVTMLLGMDSAAMKTHLLNAETIMTSSSVNVSVSTSSDTTASSFLRRRDTSTTANSTGSSNSTDTSPNNTGTTSESYFAQEAEAFLAAYQATLRTQLLPFGALMAFGSLVMVMGSFRVIVWTISDSIRDYRKAVALQGAARPPTYSPVRTRRSTESQQRWYDRFRIGSPKRKMKQRPSGDSISQPKPRTEEWASELGIAAIAALQDRAAPAQRRQPMISNVLRSNLLLDITPTGGNIPEQIETPPQSRTDDAARTSPKLKRSKTAPSGPRQISERKLADFPAMVPRPRAAPAGPRAMLADLSGTQSPQPAVKGLYPSPAPVEFLSQSPRLANRQSSGVFNAGLPPPMMPSQVSARQQFKPTAPPAPVDHSQNRASFHPYNGAATSWDDSDGEDLENDWDSISKEAARAVAFLAAKAKRAP
ncbi:plasma membrane fusion protein prm1 [Geranomyces variabilis]|uniref:Plasma membrane fusion protein PRM1 n=1 Tax=Geranomyces variabilis TaxID=109894 RepID=A0AAD5XMH0_9FUNG|nr:plasma membrane fusion protein prm1 [Geranomyces variabilis]